MCVSMYVFIRQPVVSTKTRNYRFYDTVGWGPSYRPSVFGNDTSTSSIFFPTPHLTLSTNERTNKPAKHVAKNLPGETKIKKV